ncbi:MAG: hypothetical protein ACE5K8_05450 [Candidatus Zixiibacteriota bacterium]
MVTEKSDNVKRKTRTFVSLPGHISVILLSNSGLVPLANLGYRLHLGPDRVVDGTTDHDGLVSQADVPQGDYRIELEGSTSEFFIPSLPTDVTRHPVRLPYMLFQDATPEESLPEYEEEEEIELTPESDNEGWEDLSDA